MPVFDFGQPRDLNELKRLMVDYDRWIRSRSVTTNVVVATPSSPSSSSGTSGGSAGTTTATLPAETWQRVGPVTTLLLDGTVVALTAGSPVAISSSGTWYGDGIIGVIVSAEGKKYVQQGGVADVSFSGNPTTLYLGDRLYLSATAGKAQRGWPTDATAHVIHVGYYAGTNAGITAKAVLFFDPKARGQV